MAIINYTIGTNVNGALDDATGILTVSGTGATYDYDNTNNKSAFFENATVTTSVVVESGVTTLGGTLFMGCSNITSLTLASSVVTIYGSCFRDCGLTGAIDLSNATYLGPSAFYNNKNLTSITSFNANLTEIYGSCFRDCDLTGTIDLSNITSMSSFAFYNNRNLTSITSFNASLSNIGMATFQNCDLTGTIDLSNITTPLGSYAFYNNTNLTSITGFHSDLKTIYQHCFYDCDLTGTIDLSNITSLGESAFFLNKNLTSITAFNANLTTIPDYCFMDCDLRTIDLSNVTSLGVYVFYLNRNLTSITAFNVNLKTIPTYCFRYCDLTGTIDLSNVTTLGSYVFEYNPNLTSITSFNASLTSIAAGAFGNCNLSSVDLSNITSLGNSAFEYNPNLTSITAFNAGLTNILYFTFRGTGFTSLDLSTTNITSIGNQAFRDCTSLTSFTLNSNTSALGPSCFWECTALASIDLSGLASLPVIETTNFYNCTSLTNIGGFHSNLTTIQSAAFRNCNLSSIDLASVTVILARAFMENNNLTTVSAIKDTQSLGERCFAKCFSLQGFTVAAGQTEYQVEGGVLFHYTGGTWGLKIYPSGKTTTQYVTPSFVEVILEGAFCGNKSVQQVIFTENVDTFMRFNFWYEFDDIKHIVFLCKDMKDYKTSAGAENFRFIENIVNTFVVSNNIPLNNEANAYGLTATPLFNNQYKIGGALKTIIGTRYKTATGWKPVTSKLTKVSDAWKSFETMVREELALGTGKGQGAVVGMVGDSGVICSFTAATPADDWIEKVYIIDQTSAVLLDAGPYTHAPTGDRDNTGMNINCNVGDTLTIAVTVKAGGSWNQRLSWGWIETPILTEVGDLVKIADLHSATAPYTHTYNWVVPNNPGTYIVAWWENYNSYTTGCGAKGYAERHLYSLTIT